jgi:protease-4
VHYQHTDIGAFDHSGRGEGDALFMAFKPLSMLGVGLGLQFIYPEMMSAGDAQNLGLYARLTLASAIRPLSWLSVGLNFHAFFGDNRDIQQLYSFDLGLILRPINFLSLGVVVRDLNAPVWQDGQLSRTWEFALALRPLSNDRWSISTDLQVPETGKDLRISYRMEGEPLAGWVMGLRVSHDLPVSEVSVGGFFEFRFGHFGLQSLATAHIDTSQQAAKAGWGGWMASIWYRDVAHSSLVRNSGRMPMLDIAGDLAERTHSFPLGNTRPTFLNLILAIERMTSDPEVGGVVLRIGYLQCGYAKLQELRDALGRFKQQNKKIFVYLTSAKLKSYYLASIADKIFLNPVGEISVAGLAVQHLFFAQALERIGIRPQFVKFGSYKTAPNRYTESQLTPAHREVSDQLLDDLFEQLKRDIASNRKAELAEVQRWFDKGLFTAEEAQKAKLIDVICYWDQFSRKLHNHGGSHLWFDVSYFRRQSLPTTWHGHSRRIAVIYVDGAIVSGSNIDDPLFGTRLSGAHTLISYLIRAQYDPSVHAVVLRIESPGGEVVASDLLWRYVAQLNRTKPVVVSMSSVAASGGYYIAAPAREIVASPTTITGSIGIFAGKFDFSGLLKKLGVQIETQKRGNLGDLFSAYGSWTPEQRKTLKNHIAVGYRQFLQKVAEGRKMKIKQVEALAEGRVWSGLRAKQNGLIDHLGGIWTALQRARALAGIAPDAPVHYLTWPDRPFWNLAPLRAIGLSIAQIPPPNHLAPIGTTELNPTETSTNSDPLAQMLNRLNNQSAHSVAQPQISQMIAYWIQILRRLQQPQLWAISEQFVN